MTLLARRKSPSPPAAALPSMILTLLVLMLPAAVEPRFASNDAKNITPTWATNAPLLISPSANDYLELYRFACANYTPRVSRQEILARYKSAPSERLRRLVAKWNPDRECRREETAWRYHYFDELDSVLVRDRSIDARAANVLYLTRQVKGLSIDFFTYNWGDPQVDLDNMRRVAGPNVNDDRCGAELRHMLELAADLGRRVDAIRHQIGESTSAPGGDQDYSRAMSTTGDNDSHTQNTTVLLTDSHLSLAKILDSYGRYDSGLLFGKIFAPGSYHQCIWNKLTLSAEHKVAMRYCWAHLNTRKHLDVSLRKRERTRFETNVDVLLSGICIPESCHSKSFAQYKRLFQELVNTQFQLPRSMYVDEHMEVSSIYCLVDEGSEFTIPLAGKLLICFLVSWCLLVFAVSLWNHSSRWSVATGANKLRRETFLDHLDIGNSWHDFIDDYPHKGGRLRNGAVELDTLNVVKVLGCAFVVLGHTMALYLAHSMDDIRMTKYIESQPSITLILAGTMVVDTFFVITGILWSYLMLKRINKARNSAHREPQILRAPPPPVVDWNNNNNNSSHLKNNIVASQQVTAATTCFVDAAKQVMTQETTTPMAESHPEAPEAPEESENAFRSTHSRRTRATSWRARARTFWITCLLYSGNRYLRIIPLYVMVHWFKKYVFIFAGAGPFWDHGLNQLTMSGACHKETPLTPFTFLAAYYPLSRQCIFQSWSVANDIFFALLAPPVILFMNKRPRAAAYVSALSCVVTLAFAQYGLSQVPTQVDEEIRELNSYGFYRFFDEISHFYTAPHYRIFCFLAGVWAGYFVYVYQVDLVEKRQQQHRHDRMSPQGEQVATCMSSPVPTRRFMNCTGTGGFDSEVPEPACKQVHQFQPLPQGEEEQATPRIQWPWWIRGPGTWFAIGYLLIIPPTFAYNDMLKVYLDPVYRYTYAQFLSTMRIVWAAGNAILFMRMMTDWKDTLPMRLSASRFWQIFSKLNYAMLLVHLDMLIYTIESSPSLPDSFTKWGFFNLGAGVYLACIPLSLFVHIVFENPINRLIRSLIPSR